MHLPGLRSYRIANPHSRAPNSIWHKHTKQSEENASSENPAAHLQQSKDKYFRVYDECCPTENYIYYKVVRAIPPGIHPPRDKGARIHKNFQKKLSFPKVAHTRP